MDEMRRKLVQSGGGMTLLGLVLAAGWLKPEEALAQAQTWNKAAFDTHSLPDTMKALGGGDPAQSKDIVFFQTPEIAENGAVVPVSVSSTLADVTSISILVAENPNALIASYRIPAGTIPNVANRIKMAKTSNVIAVVEAGGKLYSASKEVKVTVGGCGG